MNPRHTVTQAAPQSRAGVGARGLTLIELMVTLAVLAILLALAAPSFTTFVKNARLDSATTDIQSALSLARSEAVTRREAVSVCMSTDGSTCTGTAWKDGLLVFTNGEVGDTPGNISTNDQRLKYIQISNPALTITPIQISGTSSVFNTYIRFTPSGMADAPGRLQLCDDRNGNTGRRITLTQVGRTETTRGDPSDTDPTHAVNCPVPTTP
jgi:type IV fimbrial biogenesis protein FimT